MSDMEALLAQHPELAPDLVARVRAAASSSSSSSSSSSVSELPLTDVQIHRLRAEIQASLYLQRNLPVPEHILANVGRVGPSDILPPSDSSAPTLLPPSSLDPPLGIHSIKDMLLQRERGFVDRINARMREIALILGQPGIPAALQLHLQLERHALMLIPFQRSIRLEVATMGAAHQYFAGARTELRPRHFEFDKERHEIDAEISLTSKNQKNAVKIAREDARKSFESELRSTYEAIVEKSTRPVAAKIGRTLMSLHAKEKSQYDKTKENEQRKRVKMMRTEDEEAFKQWVTDTKQDHLKKLIEWAENLYNEIASKLNENAGLSSQSGDNPEAADAAAAAAATAAASGTASMTTSQRYFERLHRMQEVITEQPSCLVGGELKNYQLASLQWMVSLYNNKINGILADEMGLGKTIQTISLIGYLREKKNNPGPHLVVVPLSTIENWVQEFALWLPDARILRYAGHKDKRKTTQDIMTNTRAFDVVLTTYEYVTRTKDANFLRRFQWEYIIVDEGHRIKNHDCKLVKSLRMFRVRHRLLLTGTPLQNNLHELWALLHFIMPNIFKSVESFDEWFNKPFEGLGGGIAELNEEETVYTIQCLHKVLRPFLLRREKKDVETKLPERKEFIVWCDMSALQQVLYSHVQRRIYVDNGGSSAGGMPKKRSLASSIIQLRKVCNHPFIYYSSDFYERVFTDLQPGDVIRASGKFVILDSMIHKLKATGHKILLFAQWSMTLDMIEDMLAYRGYSGMYKRLDGSTSGEERAEIIRSFNDPTQPFFLFIMTTKAGGLGLNLQSADTVVLFDLDWNPQNDMQAIARAHRIGQKNEVRVFSLLTKSQFEEKLMRATSRKLQSERIVAAGGFNRMSNAERPETMLRAELMSIFNAETAIFSDQRTTSVFELNEMLARSPKDVAAFKALDKEQPMLDLMGETDVPEWIIKGGDESVQKTEIEMILEAGAGKRVREEKHYNYDLLTLHELEEMLEDGETDMQAMIGKKKEKLAQRKARGGSAPATTAGGEEPPRRGRGRPRGRPRGRGGAAAATAAVAKGRRGKRDSGDEEESVSGEEEEEEMDESMMNEEEAEGEEEDEDLADATTPASGSASASVVSMDPAQFKAKLSSIIDKLLSKTDGSGRRKPANAFKEQLSEIQDRVKAGAYTAPQTFEADVVAVFEAAAGEEGRDAQRAHDGQFLETVFGSLLETEFPDADDDKPESDSGDDDDDDQNEEPQRDDDDDYAEEETPKPARKRGRPPGSGKSSAASASASQRKKRRR